MPTYFAMAAIAVYSSAGLHERRILSSSDRFLSLPHVFGTRISPLPTSFVGKPICLFSLSPEEMENSRPLTSKLLSPLASQVSLPEGGPGQIYNPPHPTPPPFLTLHNHPLRFYLPSNYQKHTLQSANRFLHMINLRKLNCFSPLTRLAILV